MKKTLLLITNTIILLLVSSVCTRAQMVNLAFENAHTFGAGAFDVQGLYGHQSFSYKGTSEKIGDLYGGQVGVGVTNNFDLKFRYEALTAPK